MKVLKFNTLILVFFIISCSGDKKTFFDIRNNDISKISLFWEYHPITNTTEDHFDLPKEMNEAFINDFNQVKKTSKKNLPSCLSIKFYYNDGTIDEYKSNGEYLYCSKNKKYYEFLIKENLFTKYWQLNKKDLCVKHN